MTISAKDRIFGCNPISIGTCFISLFWATGSFAEMLSLPVMPFETSYPVIAEANPILEIIDAAGSKQVNFGVDIRVEGWEALVNNMIKSKLTSNKPCDRVKIAGVTTGISTFDNLLSYKSVVSELKEHCVYEKFPEIKGFKVILTDRLVRRVSAFDSYTTCGEVSAKISNGEVNFETAGVCSANSEAWLVTQEAIKALESELEKGKWGTLLPANAPEHQAVFEQASFSAAPDGGFDVRVTARLVNPSDEVVEFLRDYAKE